MKPISMTSTTLTPILDNNVGGAFGSVGPASAAVIEDSETPSGPWTTTSVSAGDYFEGSIQSPSDADWVAIELVAGVTYTINFDGKDCYDSNCGSLADPFLELRNGLLQQVTIDGELMIDGNSGDGASALLSFKADTTGTFYLALTSEDGGTGSYTLHVEDDQPKPAPTTGTIEEMAEYLQSGYTSGTEYTFDTSSSNVITVNISGLKAEDQQLALWAMEAWEMVANLDFQVVTSGEMITVDDAKFGVFAYFPGTVSADGVEININPSGVGSTPDSFAFQIYVQQFGNAIGLGNLGNYQLGYLTSDNGEGKVFTNDSWQLSVMSNEPQNSTAATDASYGFVTGPMMVDIYAIQDFYGAPGASSATAGNTTYGLGSNLGNYMDEIFAGLASGETSDTYVGNPVAFTIYDQGGIDTLNISFLEASEAANINLNDGTFSDFGDIIGIMGIAMGTVLENVISGDGNDTLTGNEANNMLMAGDGDDLVYSGTGNDTTSGGTGDDTLYGGGGNDSIKGGSGKDAAFGGVGNDTLNGGTGADLLGGSAGNDSISGEKGNDTLWGSSGNDVISGGEGDDFAGGGANKDILTGNSGNDTLYGGGGKDTVSGGTESDLVAGGSGTDVVSGGDGADTLWGQAGADTLSGGNGNDVIAGGSQGDVLNGQQGDDTLNGGFGNDTLFGSAGNDVLNGNFGNDVLIGGLGADSFIIDSGGAKTVTDFDESEEDLLYLDSALWGGVNLSKSQVLATYADDSSGTVIFDFGGGTTITMAGVSSTAGLADDLLIL